MEAQVLEEIRRIAARELEHATPIEPTLRLKEDLHLDSLAMVIVAVGLENHFRVKLEEQSAGSISTVGDLVALVARRVQERGAAL